MMRFVFVLGVALGCTADPEVAAILALSADEAAGEALFATHCVGCHGEDGTGGTGPGIDHPHSETTTIGTILDGGGGMPAFAGQLTDQEVADLHAFVQASIYR